MIIIDNVQLSDELITEQFVCNLERCKGGCCVDGDCGAPLSDEEVVILKEIYPTIKPYLLPEYIAELEKQGLSVWDNEYGNVTPTVNGGICVYGYTDELGIVKCGIERAWKDGAISFQKPISCHLYPARITVSGETEMVNYDPRPDLCSPACQLGAQLKVPVYKFLKDSLVRKYGTEFYQLLEEIAEMPHFKV
jgi:hypothetical protein